MPKSRTATARAHPAAPARASRPVERRPINPQLYFDIAAITLYAVSVVVGLALVKEQLTGPVGSWLVRLIRLLLGEGVYLSPVLLFLLGNAITGPPRRGRPTAVAGGIGLVLVFLGWMHLFAWGDGDLFASTGARWASLFHRPTPALQALMTRGDGGLIGALLTAVLSPLSVAGSYVVLVAALISSGLLLTETTLATMGHRVRERSRQAAAIARREHLMTAAPPPVLRPGPQPRAGRRRRGVFLEVPSCQEGMPDEVPVAPVGSRQKAVGSKDRASGLPTADFRLPTAGPAALPPAREVTEELETLPVPEVPRWMPNLRNVMLRARAIREAALSPLPASEEGNAHHGDTETRRGEALEDRMPRIGQDESSERSERVPAINSSSDGSEPVRSNPVHPVKSDTVSPSVSPCLRGENPSTARFEKEVVRETMIERLIRERSREATAEEAGPPPPPRERAPVRIGGASQAQSAMMAGDPDTEYVLPSTELLNAPVVVDNTAATKETHDNIALLEACLAEFNIEATVVEIADGPTVTRYEIRLGSGIRVKRITDLADNITMSLAALSGVRVEAPIPGKSAIGIEVPKKATTLVSLRECIETEDFLNHPSKVAFTLGKAVDGSVRFADLVKMPHLLIAGATNSGKSISLNVLIASMLFRARPDEVKFLFIDPKRVELTLFEGIPHLIHPVVKDVKQAAGILRWALQEMDRRYDLFAMALTRNIDGYNAKVEDDPRKRLPYIVIVIDELADLMMLQGPEVEQAICRLAQLARATGIHLVVATQRPSVDVITGLIKANVPSRVAFSVTSQIDSRTILDMKGAENLIGRGDMLFKPVDANKPLRIQGAFLHESEVARLVEYLKTQGKPEYIATPVSVDSASTRIEEEEFDDDLLEPAAKFIVTQGVGSTSLVQRKFRIGYTRAARLMEMMEARGIVGPIDGGKPREILMSRDRVELLFRSATNAIYQEEEPIEDVEEPVMIEYADEPAAIEEEEDAIPGEVEPLYGGEEEEESPFTE